MFYTSKFRTLEREVHDGFFCFCFIQSRWVVELEDRKPKISYFDANGEKKGQLKSQTEVDLEKWIDIKFFK